MRRRARRAGLPGMAFDSYGRTLALREMARRRRVGGAAFHALVNPLSCVRYMEFDFAARALADLPNGPARVLDVSSPRLFPFWAAEKRGLRVTMINPDPKDIARTRSVVALVRAHAGLEVAGEVDATRLPFEDDCFDVATSISVIEHVGGDGDAPGGDSTVVDELVRVVRPGGRIVLTFPVKPTFENEYRAVDYYGTQESGPAGRHFFQRFYDEKAIAGRLLGCPGIREERRRYYVEDPPGWFAEYEQEWIRTGLAHTVQDPWFMAQHFHDAGTSHPTDRTGVCGLALSVDKRGGRAT